MDATKQLLFEIIEQCSKNNITATTEWKNNDMALRVDGFSKSGTACVFIENGEVICETRYNTRTPIESFDDLADIAYDWWIRYKDRQVFAEPHSGWATVFLTKGWIVPETGPTTYKVKRQ